MKVITIFGLIISAISALIGFVMFVKLPCYQTAYLFAYNIGIAVYCAIFLHWICYIEGSIEQLTNKSNQLRYQQQYQPYQSYQPRKNIVMKKTGKFNPRVIQQQTIQTTCPVCNNTINVNQSDTVIYCKYCGQKLELQ